ncbi:MAG: DNA mismatch repair endonuclease MutL [Christensenellaceae bacterium]|jgi:DNA mismatch repair protein MutL
MGKIQILAEQVSSRIAAGEVIERPASIVKELLENALDAGASAITVSIEEGGVREIRVTDNGEGIAPEDMPLSIVKHATSKIFTLSDLEEITSLGFRGEALASIAAVSMLTIKSKTKTEALGSELHVKGGRTEYIREVGIAEGTTVLVENLFYNTPARLKFLRKQSAETSAVSDIVARLILAKPEVSIRFVAAGKVVYHSPGNGTLQDAIYSVYGHDWQKALISVSFSFQKIKIEGFIGTPERSLKTQRQGSFFVNERYIQSAFLQKAIVRAYGERLLKGAFPFYVLKIALPSEEVDVNVHPNKLQIHFRDKNEITYVLEEAISAALQEHYFPPKASFFAPEPMEEKTPSAVIDIYSTIPADEEDLVNAPVPSIAELMDEMKKTALSAPDFYLKEPSVFAETQQDIEKIEQIGFAAPQEAKQEKPESTSFFTEELPIRVLGQAFYAYIIVEMGDMLFILDQHAAHERLLYDKLTAHTRENGIVQLLLVPVAFNLSQEDYLKLSENLDLFLEMGFQVELLEHRCCRILAVPQILGEISVRDSFEDMLANLEEGESSSLSIRKDRLAKGACKRAVKAGDPLLETDIRALLAGFTKTGVLPHCPHGRPIAISITKTQLEKEFRRIV